MKTAVCALALAALMGTVNVQAARAAERLPGGGLFAKPNLVAWCIVPFDTAKRGPQQRAEMLEKLGIRKFAYDWRAPHIPTFEEEIVQIKKHGVEYFAFWGFHPEIVPLLEKHQVRPQFWATVSSPAGASEEEKIAAAAKQLAPMVEKTRALGCKFGLYNHGGWGGEPANMVAVTKRLRQAGSNDHVGIVYNFHHGHEHIADFADVLAVMQPYLLCINLNGMNDNAKPKILPIGSGQHELKMMEAIKRSGYTGPIGILGHRAEMDAEVSLRQNLDGMKKTLKQMGDTAALKTYD